MILMIDNYDSFTYNLVQYLGELGAEVVVHRNDEITLSEIEALQPEKIVISPGPCTPHEAGISLELIARFHLQTPIFGVCLGHQCIGQFFGGLVRRAENVMHGKTSAIHHTNQGVFDGLPQAFQATRYHSLIVAQENLPDCLELTAWTQEKDETTQPDQVKEIMGFRHRSLPIEGVQFHPESLFTKAGKNLLANFLEAS